jgi:hypothetical protein
MKIDYIRSAIFGSGIFIAIVIFWKYDAWFFVNLDVDSLIITIFSILVGFQMTIFSHMYGINFSSIKNKSLQNKADNSIKRKFNRQYILFFAYFFVIAITLLSDVLKNHGWVGFLDRISLASTFCSLIWSIEIPRLIWQLRNEV